ncbi:MAG: DUF692 domain-containing protein [Gammaproteobacteria bacterium]|nr:DUF692 domain-containing protein [Gammaproteobacteria bacterium]
MTHSKQKQQFPYLGFGLGLRPDHYETILEQSPKVDWFEIITENYLVPGGKPLYFLNQIRENYPVVMHGVSLSIGSTDPIDWDYLKAVKALAERIEPVWLSDHLCWTGVNGINLHDLLPLPYTQEAIEHLVSRISQVQDYLKRPILIENVSSYLTYQHSEMTEWEFLAEITKRAGNHILLDVNNIYVSAYNHGFDPEAYLKGIPEGRVQQIHLAGHANHGDYIIDTHDAPVIQPVWELYAKTLERFGAVSTMIERDANIPPLPELLEELDQARQISQKSLEEKSFA